MEKLLRVAEMRDLDKQVTKGEISYSRMVEIINEKFYLKLTELQKDKCKEKGHNMYSVYSLNNFHNNGRSAFGLNKCSLCGFEDNWQYDF